MGELWNFQVFSSHLEHTLILVLCRYCRRDEGFQATEGWDPMTGLGTPNYPKMHDVFMSLP